MKKLTIHAGMHKCGTSSIQQALYKYNGYEIFYPRLSNTNHSLDITATFDYQNSAYAGFKYMVPKQIQELSERTLVTLDSALECHENLILSGEDIGLMTANGVNKMLTYFRDKVDYIQIIFYLRNPESFASSAFQEYLKQGMEDLPSHIDPRYRFRIEKFLTSKLIDNLIIREFDSKKLRSGCVISDLFELLKIDNPYDSNISTNESLSELASKILWRFNTSLKLKPEDRTCQQARHLFNKIIRRLFKSSKSVDKSMFYFLAETNDLNFLADACNFTFTSDFNHSSLKNKHQSVDSLNSLGKHLENISFDELKPLLSWLKKRDESSNPLDVDSLIRRSFIECVKINSTRVML